MNNEHIHCRSCITGIVLLLCLQCIVISDHASIGFADSSPYCEESCITYIYSTEDAALLKETYTIIQPYAMLSIDEFSNTMGTKMISRRKPYFAVNGNQVFFGDMYFDDDSTIDYHGIYQIEWNNNEFIIHPIFNITISMAKQDVVQILVQNDVINCKEVPLMHNFTYANTIIQIGCMDNSNSNMPCLYVWQFLFDDTDRLVRIVFKIQ